LERRSKKKFENIKEEYIIFSQDECSFNSESNKTYSWGLSGVASEYLGYTKGIKINCFGSLNLENGELTTTTHKKGNYESTIEHLNKVRENYPKKKLLFLMDNATWHKKEEVKKFCEDNNIELIFLPPYSPELNPIERVWSFLKSKVKQFFFRKAEEFRKFVETLLGEINEINIIQLKKLCSILI